MRLDLSDDTINELQQRSIVRLIALAKEANCADIVLRINGRNEVIQADWLKHLKFAEAVDGG